VSEKGEDVELSYWFPQMMNQGWDLLKEACLAFIVVRVHQVGYVVQEVSMSEGVLFLVLGFKHPNVKESTESWGLQESLSNLN